MPLTFGKSSKKTMSNTERAQKAALRKMIKNKKLKQDISMHLKTLTKVAELV